MTFQHIHVAEISKRRAIRDHPCQADLSVALKQTEAQRISHRAFNDGARNLFGPISARQKCVNGGDIEFGGICRDGEPVLFPFSVHKQKTPPALPAGFEIFQCD